MSFLYSFLDRVSTVLMDLDPDSKRNIASLEDKILCLDITAPEIVLFLIPDGDGIRIKEQSDREADVTLSGPLTAFARLGMGGSESGVLSNGQVIMKGDADIGQTFQKVLGQIDLDLEELLSRYIGDVPARKTGNAARRAGEWVGETIDLSSENVADFLTEEAKLLITPVAMERMENGVHDLRSNVDRLEQRIRRLEEARVRNPQNSG
ncbi:MAG: hypothetical protein GKR95_18315 [Gammaproteobacteria bacterium]|nr:hypothetical protein [Gammaproteobacteria bacterium]NKB63978.1 hypothetical protein [Gammaproteobacteria bacterium]